jgi:ribosomal protein S18 acetylase RimI-like enzyme
MSIAMRAARADDAGDIVRVLRASRLAFLPYAPPAHAQSEDLEWARETLIPSRGVTVAEVDGAVVGVVAVCRREGSSWIEQLYIQPEFCGRGIGTSLLKDALLSLRRPVCLYTFQENWRARRFYERFGFRPIEFGDGSDNEERCPDVLYELR